MSEREPQPPLVVHIIYALGTGGLENGLVTIINRCPPSRYRHAIICLTGAERFASRLTAPDVEVIELHKKPGHDLGIYWRLWQHLRRLRPAIVHTRNLAALETQVLGLLMPGTRRVHGEHGRDMSDLDGSNRKYQWLRRMLSPLIHRFVAVSQDLSRWLIQTVHIPPFKVTQIYDGVDAERFVRDPEQSYAAPAGLPEGFQSGADVVVLGTVGRLAAVKDQKLLLVAVHRLLSARPEYRARLRLVIVGDGPEREALTAQADQLSLNEVVWLTGDRDDIPELLRAMDVFVLPSLGEGLPLTILEAMATGLPVIATTVGGVPELVREGTTGLLFPPRNAEALAQAIITLIEDPSLRHSMGRTAETHIRQNFSWQGTIDSYLALYDSLLHPKKTRSREENH